MSGLATTPRRLHPLTPIAKAGRVLPPVLVGLVVVIGSDLPGGPLLRALILIALSVLIVVVVAGFTYVAWTRTSFWFDDDGDLRIASGLLRRQERRVQLSRLQAVDLVQPIIARLIGLAELKPEVAGGDSAQVSLAFLTLDQANDLRRELLARAAGIRTGEEESAPEAPERILVRVPPRDLALSQLISESLIFGVIGGAVILTIAFFTEGFGALFGLLFAVATPVIASVNGFLANYDFTMAESPDGLRLRRGLLTTRSQTVPPGRVQAVEIAQPLLWRRFGWVRLRVNVAGYGSGDNDSGSESTVLLPVAPVLVANAVLARVLPGVEVEKVPLAPAPRGARWRSWWQYPRLAAGHDDTVFVARTGRLVRRLSVIPHVRTQSVRVTQGPWERALGLASMHVDSTPGPVTVTAAHRSLADATLLATDQARRASAARQVAPPERWMLDRMRHIKAGRPSPAPEVDDERAGAS